MDITYRTILVPLDGSELAAEALPHAQTLAAATGASVIVIQVVPDTSSWPEVLDQSRNLMRIEEREQRFLDHASAALARVVADLRLYQIQAEAVVEIGDPAAQIVDYAAANQVDLIVMSTHGRTGLARWVYGSVADKVLRSAPCPVYLVRSSVR